MGENRVFDCLYIDVPGIAVMSLQTPTEEVDVFGTATKRGLDDHEGLATLVMTLPAPQGTLEAVVVDPLAHFAATSLFKDPLHPIEELRRDKRFVPAGELVVLIHDLSQVVAVPQHGGELGLRNGLRWTTGRRPSSEATSCQLLDQLVHRVVAAGEQFEGRHDQRYTLRNWTDDPDFAVLAVLPSVEVAERCKAEGATLAGLLAHLVPNIRTIAFGPELVHGGQQGMHQLTFRCLVDRFGCGDQTHAVATKLHEHHRVIDPIAVHSRQLVDHDVVDVSRHPDAFQHLLKGDLLVHGGRRAARFHILIHDPNTQLPGLVLARSPLGGNGKPLGVVVGLNLRFRAHPQIENGSLPPSHD